MNPVKSFSIQKMTCPDNEWIWALFDADGKHLLSKSGYKSAELAGQSICHILETVGANTQEVEIWIERKVRSRFHCGGENASTDV